MNNKKYINLLFASTSDYMKNAAVTIMSAIDNLEDNVGINIYYLYADVFNPIDDTRRNDLIEQILYTFKDKDVNFNFIDVTDKMCLFENLNVGMWEKEMSLTHYMYLLAPLFVENVDKLIYLDCDVVVNCNLCKIYDIDMEDKLIAMASPSGFEVEADTSNSGLSLINLKQWKKEDILHTLIKFGENLPKCDFCDQYLLNEYFKKRHLDRLTLIDKTYNIFPMTYPELSLDEIKNLHYAGPNLKPWNEMECMCRGSFLWWKYARKTAFYESFIDDYFKNQLNILKQDFEYKLYLQAQQNEEIRRQIYDNMQQMIKDYDMKKYRSSFSYLYFIKPYKCLLKTFVAIRLSFFEDVL